jgi:hypothetical protein
MGKMKVNVPKVSGKQCGIGWVDGWMDVDGRMNRWVDVKAVLRIASCNQ